MLQQIDSKHLAALESELARVKAQRDALRDALRRIDDRHARTAMPDKASDRCIAYAAARIDAQTIARTALQACQD